MSNGALRTERETACLRHCSSGVAAAFLLRHTASGFADPLSSIAFR
jgi:hypothetical protein